MITFKIITRFTQSYTIWILKNSVNIYRLSKKDLHYVWSRLDLETSLLNKTIFVEILRLDVVKTNIAEIIKKQCIIHVKQKTWKKGICCSLSFPFNFLNKHIYNRLYDSSNIIFVGINHGLYMLSAKWRVIINRVELRRW